MGKEKVTPLLFYKGACVLSYDLSMTAKLIFYIFICIYLYVYAGVCVGERQAPVEIRG